MTGAKWMQVRKGPSQPLCQRSHKDIQKSRCNLCPFVSVLDGFVDNFSSAKQVLLLLSHPRLSFGSSISSRFLSLDVGACDFSGRTVPWLNPNRPVERTRQTHLRNDTRAAMSARRDLANAALLVLASAPAVLAYVAVLRGCDWDTAKRAGGVPTWPMPTHSATLWCAWSHEHPFWLANLLFLVCISLFFWLISLVQGSTWLIDPYWTFIPVLLAAFYRHHPAAEARDEPRAIVAVLLLLLWSLRLTHSYFRREGWMLGKREDWRFEEMRKKHTQHWWWMSFFAAYFSQQIMLVGICMPLYAVHFASQRAWTLLDTAATVLCVAGIAIAYVADTQLHGFVKNNERRAASRQRKIPVLNTGIWKYSRHPNYLGEQLFWWGMGLFAVGVGWTFALWGAAFNSLVLAIVTVMVEQKMLQKKYRREAFKEYQRCTSVWITWFPKPPLPTSAKTE